MLISRLVRAKALAACAGDWLADLPALVRELEDRWSITVGRSLEGGTEAFVARWISRLLVVRGNGASRAIPNLGPRPLIPR